MLADQIETHARCRYGTYHDYIRCVGRYVSFVEEAMGLQVSLQLLYNHHHQCQRRALSSRYVSEIQKFRCAAFEQVNNLRE